MITRLASPYRFRNLARVITPALEGAWVLLFAVGIYTAFFASPADYQQGETVRIMYVHVPSAYMATMIYAAMAVAAFVYFVWKHLLTEIFVRAAAPVGMVFTAVCLATGSLWGKPMWGAWWVWDARLTSVLILFFLYLAYMMFVSAFPNRPGRRLGLVFVLIGAVNLPIVKFSVDWWQTLHQPASLIRAGGIAIDGAFLTPLFLMLGFVTVFSAWVILQRIEILLLDDKYRHRHLPEELR